MFYLNISVLPTSSKLDGLKQQPVFIVDDSAGWPVRLGLAGQFWQSLLGSLMNYGQLPG